MLVILLVRSINYAGSGHMEIEAKKKVKEVCLPGQM